MRTIPALGLAVTLLVGCGSPINTIRFGAKAGTLVVLQQLDADVPTAEQVKTISMALEDFTDGDGNVDIAAFRSLFLSLINDQFDGTDAIIMATLVDEVVALVAAEIDETPELSGDIALYLNAGAKGVTQGCELYILIETSQ